MLLVGQSTRWEVAVMHIEKPILMKGEFACPCRMRKRKGEKRVVQTERKQENGVWFNYAVMKLFALMNMSSCTI